MSNLEQLMTALENASNNGNTEDARKIAQIIKQAQSAPSNQRPDSAFGHSVDQAQKLGGQAIRTVGSALNVDSITNLGNNIVAQQDKDIAEGGYQSPLGDMNFMDALGEGKGLEWVATRGAENAVSVAAVPIATAGSALATFLGAPIAAIGLGAAATVGGIGLGIGSVTSTAEEKGLDVEDQSTAAKNLGIGSVIGVLDRIGAGSLIPKKKLATMTVGQVAETLAKKNPSMAKKFLSSTFKGGVSEGATEGAQTAVEIAGVAAQGGEFTKDEVINDVIDNFVLGSSTGSAISGTSSLASGTKNKIVGDDTPVDQEAATAFAQDIEAKAADGGFDLSDPDVTSSTGAVRAVDNLQSSYNEQIKSIENIFGKDLKYDQKKDTPEVRERKVAVQTALKKAKNKAKNTVDPSELKAVEEQVGNTAEGQELIMLMRKTNELTRLHNKGYKGGVSRITDVLNPFDSGSQYNAGRILSAPIIGMSSGAAAFGSGGATILPQTAAVIGGRAIDKYTGRRSIVERYTKQNKDGKVEQRPKKASRLLVHQAIEAQKVFAKQQEKLAEQQEALRQEEVAQAAFDAGDPPKGSPTDPNPSPEWIVMDALGTSDRGEIDSIMQDIKDNRPELAGAVDSYLLGIQRGTNVLDLTALVRAARAAAGIDTQLTSRQQGQINAHEEKQLSARQQDGKNANLNMLETIKQAINEDKTIDNSDKAKLQKAALELGQNLGSKPLEKAEAIVAKVTSKLKQPSLAAKYLSSYVERVAGQQSAKS